MLTNCDRCLAEIEDDEITDCYDCGLDGVCETCLGDHECDPDDYDEFWFDEEGE